MSLQCNDFLSNFKDTGRQTGSFVTLTSVTVSGVYIDKDGLSGLNVSHKTEAKCINGDGLTAHDKI